MYGSYTQRAADLGKEFKEHFGELNAKQLWLIAKLAKLIRRSCRQNTAFNNAMKAAFPHATFKQVPKEDKRSGRTYEGLAITVNSVTAEDDADED